MTDGSPRRHNLRFASLIAATLIATVFLLFAAPRDVYAFNWGAALFTGKNVADAEKDRRGLKKFFGDIIDRASEGLSGAIAGDDSAPDKALQGQQEALGRLLIHKIDPTDGGATAFYGKLNNKLKSAGDKIKSFVKGASDTVSNARTGTVVDRRSALAVSARERTLYESGTGILGNKPLPKPATAKTGPANSSLRSKFKEWARQHEQYPHCWGAVDANHDPYKCMAEADAKRTAADRAKKAQPHKPSEKKFDWSSEWTVEGDGLQVWNRSNSRYDDKDREAARVAHYASRCWGEHYATRDNPLLYDRMNSRMERNECPEQEGSQEQAAETKSDYEASLANALGKDSPGSGEQPHGGENAGDNYGQDDYALALTRTLDEDTEEVPNDYQIALDQLDSLQDKSRLDREKSAQQTEPIDPQPATQSRSGGVNCAEVNPGVKQAMYDAAERAKGDYTQAYCAAINIARAVIWKAKQCLEHDRDLSAVQRSQLESQLTLTRQSITQNMESARRALGTKANCPCWSQYCAS